MKDLRKLVRFVRSLPEDRRRALAGASMPYGGFIMNEATGDGVRRPPDCPSWRDLAARICQTREADHPPPSPPSEGRRQTRTGQGEGAAMKEIQVTKAVPVTAWDGNDGRVASLLAAEIAAALVAAGVLTITRDSYDGTENVEVTISFMAAEVADVPA